jgi:hypothetical protein
MVDKELEEALGKIEKAKAKAKVTLEKIEDDRKQAKKKLA